MNEETTHLDLRPDHWAVVRNILQRYVPDRQVVTFGSRATWTAKNYSDLDLAIIGKESLPLDISTALVDAFSESDLPFKVDIVDWASIDETFRKIIRRDGLSVHVPAQGSDAVSHLDQSISTLGDYVDLQRGSTYKSALLGQDGPVLLGLASIARNGGFRPDNLKTYGGPSDKRILLEPGDIYVSLKDVTQSADLLGAIARVPDTISQGRLTQDTVKLNFKDDESAKTYIYWMLRTPQYRAYCKAHATGTINLGLSRDDFLSFPIPSLTPTRRTFLQLVESLEDKIELNRRMNETLEAMARAIFKDWFVDFGPVRAKMEGRAPYLAPDLWELFPDMLDGEGKPVGWMRRRLGDFLKLAYGKSLPATKRILGKVPVYGSGGIAGTHDTALIEGPAVIVGRKGTVGSLYWEDQPVFPIDTVFYVVPCIGSFLFSYHLLATQPLRNMNTDAAVPGLNRGNVYRIKFPQPTLELISAFEDIVDAVWRCRAKSLKEIETLSHIRDLLLPKLMSGKIRLPDAERAVEVVAP